MRDIEIAVDGRWAVRLVTWALGGVWGVIWTVEWQRGEDGFIYTRASRISLAGPEKTLALQYASRVSGLRWETTPDGTQQGFDSA